MQDVILISRQDLKAAFIEWSAIQSKPQSTNWLTVQDLAQYLGYSKHWVYQKLSRKNRLLTTDLPPYHRRGKRILFNQSEVDAWLKGTDNEN